MNTRDIIINEQTEFLTYLKTKFNIIHNSNVFFRDFQYGLRSYLKEKKAKNLNYNEGENLAKEVCQELTIKGIFTKIDHQSWRLNYPDFALPRNEKKAS